MTSSLVYPALRSKPPPFGAVAGYGASYAPNGPGPAYLWVPGSVERAGGAQVTLAGASYAGLNGANCLAAVKNGFSPKYATSAGGNQVSVTTGTPGATFLVVLESFGGAAGSAYANLLSVGPTATSGGLGINTSNALLLRMGGTNQVSTLTVPSGPAVLIGGWTRSVAGYLYCNGAQYVVASTNFSQAATTVTSMGGVSGQSSITANIALAAVWNRLLTPDEFAALSDDPWQLFRPVQRRLYFGAAAGGNVWNLSLAESGSASDAPGALAAFTPSIVEGGLAADLPSATAAFAAALAETGAASDAPVGGATYAAAVAESGAAGDAPGATAVYTVTLSEVGSASELESVGGASSSVAIVESGSALDAVTATVAFAAAIGEFGSALDAPAALAAYAASVAETGSAQDAPAATASFLVSIAEVGSAVDSETFGGAASSAAIAESGNARDAVSALVTFSAAMVEGGNATDAQAATAALSALIAEQGTALDAPNAIANMSVSVVEAGAALDVTSWSLPYTLATDPHFIVPTLARSFTVRALGRTFIVTTLNRKFDA